jgi:hypothetical protein
VGLLFKRSYFPSPLLQSSIPPLSCAVFPVSLSSRALHPFFQRGLAMAAAQAISKGSVVSPCGNRAAPGLLARRRGAVAARMAPSAARIGGFWRKNAFPGGRLTLRTRRSRAASPAQVNIQDVLVITGFSLSIFFVVHVYLNFFFFEVLRLI